MLKSQSWTAHQKSTICICFIHEKNIIFYYNKPFIFLQDKHDKGMNLAAEKYKDLLCWIRMETFINDTNKGALVWSQYPTVRESKTTQSIN
jgi:hypothetical protein